jgi:hypothetical protein
MVSGKRDVLILKSAIDVNTISIPPRHSTSYTCLRLK